SASFHAFAAKLAAVLSKSAASPSVIVFMTISQMRGMRAEIAAPSASVQLGGFFPTAIPPHKIVIGGHWRPRLSGRHSRRIALGGQAARAGSATLETGNGTGYRLCQRGGGRRDLVPVALRVAAGAALSVLHGRRLRR